MFQFIQEFREATRFGPNAEQVGASRRGEPRSAETVSFKSGKPRSKLFFPGEFSGVGIPAKEYRADFLQQSPRQIARGDIRWKRGKMQIQTHFQLWEHAPAQKLHEMRRHLRIGAGQGERKLKCYARPVQCRSERTECAEQGVRRSFSGKIQCRRVNSCFGKCGEEVSGSFGKFAEEGGGQFFLRQRCDCADLDIIEGIERFCNEFGRGSVFEQIRGKLDGGKVFRLKKFRKVFGWNFRDAAGNAECAAISGIVRSIRLIGIRLLRAFPL